MAESHHHSRRRPREGWASGSSIPVSMLRDRSAGIVVDDIDAELNGRHGHFSDGSEGVREPTDTTTRAAHPCDRDLFTASVRGAGGRYELPYAHFSRMRIAPQSAKLVVHAAEWRPGTSTQHAQRSLHFGEKGFDFARRVFSFEAGKHPIVTMSRRGCCEARVHADAIQLVRVTGLSAQKADECIRLRCDGVIGPFDCFRAIVLIAGDQCALRLQSGDGDVSHSPIARSIGCGSPTSKPRRLLDWKRSIGYHVGLWSV